MFVRKWCFESLGGHYQGFKPDALKKDINAIGITVLKNEPFYVHPPVIIYDPKSIFRLAVSGEKNYSIIKSIIMHFSSLIISIVNPVFIFLAYFQIISLLLQRKE